MIYSGADLSGRFVSIHSLPSNRFSRLINKILKLDANLFRKLHPDFKLLPPYHTLRNIVCVCLLRINWIKAEDVSKIFLLVLKRFVLVS